MYIPLIPSSKANGNGRIQMPSRRGRGNEHGNYDASTESEADLKEAAVCRWAQCVGRICEECSDGRDAGESTDLLF